MSQTEGNFVTPTFWVGGTKVSSIPPYFMVFFRFCQFRHFLRTPRTWNRDSSIFSNFHDPGYMKPCKNQRLQFSLIFMTPDTWNLAKIRCSIFSNFHKKSDEIEKTWKNPWNRAKSKKRRALLFLQLEKLEVQKCPPFDSKLMIWFQYAQITLLVKSRLPF